MPGCRVVNSPLARASPRRVLGAKIQLKDIKLVSLVGSGGFGSVFKGTYKGQNVAVKKLHTYTKNPKAQKESFKAELRVLRLSHPNVVKTFAYGYNEYESGEVSDIGFLLMEYAGDRNLQHIIDCERELLDPLRRLKYALDIVSALDFAHGIGIVHLDIKPANIIINGDDTCKVGDFGCCQHLVEGTGQVSPTQRSYLTGTFAYRAPELLKGEAPTAKADVYSLGITLWQMLSRESPYYKQNQHVVIFGVVAYNLRPKLPTKDDCPFDLCYQDLFVQCWDADRAIRPSASEIKEVLEIWREFA
ncbi:serine/threonine-protein kinase mos [Lingula anatina]|uniref:non-specific serine/threonine protein kinase n=1 Tax=Lingula anatina TaxID=7574 RepID=A0A1S3JCY0_LINAN|nr:serine/threonine-protein kinase mos [Lingula anatina]|eukprot:XP_013408178.1 serine/threonine-protein kinase mos [Lingula anatina]